jgi:hypothetical protein
MYFGYNDFQFLYTRSFYLKKHPYSRIFNKSAPVVKKKSLEYPLCSKAMCWPLILNRFNEVDFAKKIVNQF